MNIYFARLTQSIPALLWLVICTVCSCGALGFGGCGFGAGITPVSCNTRNVFWAGPIRYTPFCEAMEQARHLNCPPAYVNSVTDSLQPSQSSPSSCWIPPFAPPPCKCIHKSGVVGIAAKSANGVPTPNFFLSSARVSAYDDAVADDEGGEV